MSNLHPFPSRAAALLLALSLSPVAMGQVFDVTVGPYGNPGTTVFQSIAPAAYHVSQIDVRTDSVGPVGLRLRFADYGHTTEQISGWLGGSTGTEESFAIPPGDYLKRAVISYTATGIRGLVLETADGALGAFGGSSPVFMKATLELSGHEIIGVQGRSGPNGAGVERLMSLGIFARPTWESTFAYAGNAVGASFEFTSAPLGQRLASYSQVHYVQNTGYTGFLWDLVERDLSAAPAQLFGGTGNVSSSSSTPGDPRLFVTELRVGFYADTSGIMRLVKLGLTHSDGQSEDSMISSLIPTVERTFQAAAGHELVGVYGQRNNDGTIASLGAIQRPLLATTNFTSSGCTAPSTGRAMVLGTAAGVATLGASGHVVAITQAPPLVAAALLLSAAGSNASLSGCNLHVDLNSLVALPPILTSAQGSASWTLPVPFDLNLLDATLYTQALAVDLGSLVLSNGHEITLGGV